MLGCKCLFCCRQDWAWPLQLLIRAQGRSNNSHDALIWARLGDISSDRNQVRYSNIRTDKQSFSFIFPLLMSPISCSSTCKVCALLRHTKVASRSDSFRPRSSGWLTTEHPQWHLWILVERDRYRKEVVSVPRLVFFSKVIRNMKRGGRIAARGCRGACLVTWMALLLSGMETEMCSLLRTRNSLPWAWLWCIPWLAKSFLVHQQQKGLKIKFYGRVQGLSWLGPNPPSPTASSTCSTCAAACLLLLPAAQITFVGIHPTLLKRNALLQLYPRQQSIWYEPTMRRLVWLTTRGITVGVAFRLTTVDCFFRVSQ